MHAILDQLKIPAIVAPMFLVSNPAITIAACAEGIMGSLPAHGTRSHEMLEQWLIEVSHGLDELRAQDSARRVAPFAVNLVVHPSNTRYSRDLDICVKHRVPVILTSKGAPGALVRRIHDYGGIVLHDVASRRHAEKALEAGVDGLIAVAGGAGGHTGTINPFALVNEIRQIYDGPLALAGGITTGRDILAAEVMGCDLAYIGTRFIASHESGAPYRHKKMIIESMATDIFLSAAITGAPANWLAKSLTAAGIDLEELAITRPGKIVSPSERKKRWKDIWTAGHGVGNIKDIPSTATLCRRLVNEYHTAKAELHTSHSHRST